MSSLSLSNSFHLIVWILLETRSRKFRFFLLSFVCSVSSDAGNSGSSVVERSVSFGVASSSRTDTDMFCQNFILNYTGRKDGKRDDGDDNGSSDAEDFEVHIDLTDDLLHMVHHFYFRILR